MSLDQFDPALISVVMPCHNAAPYVEEAVASVLGQSYPQVELVIVDDGSTDGLDGEVRRARASFPLCLVTMEKNRGAAAARNAGIDAARGRYVALLDSDDGWHPEKLERQFRQLEQANDAALVSLTRQFVTGNGNHVAPARPMTTQDKVGEYLFLNGGVIQSSMMFLRTGLARAVRMEDGSRRHDDWSFALRLEQAGCRFEMLEEPLTLYNDAGGRTRRSPSYSADRLKWLDERRGQLGEAAWLAARATVASHLRGDADVHPVRLIGEAWREGAIGPARTAYYLVVWAAPPLRRLATGMMRRWSS